MAMNNLLFAERGRLEGHIYGIDIARILAMYLVCFGHVVFLGEFTTYSTGSNAWLVNLFNIVTVGCVDLFALISGFVGTGVSQVKVKSYMRLWSLAFFYNAVVLTCYGMFDHVDVGVRDFLPVWGNRYWYFTAYTGVLVVAPVINRGLADISKRDAILTLSGILCLSISTCFTTVDLFSLHCGYSFVWLLVMYVVGGIVRKYKIVDGTKAAFSLCVAIFTVLLCVTNLGLPIISVSYTSPFIILAMVLVLEMCLSIRITSSGWGVKVLAAISSCTFSVYLIHVQRQIFNGPLKEVCVFLREYITSCGSYALIFIPIIGLCIFALCAGIDLLRKKNTWCIQRMVMKENRQTFSMLLHRTDIRRGWRNGARAGMHADIVNLPSRGCDVPRSYLDIGQAKVRIGWGPMVKFRDGIARTIAWQRANTMVFG